jgi:hypothetical protein
MIEVVNSTGPYTTYEVSPLVIKHDIVIEVEILFQISLIWNSNVQLTLSTRLVSGVVLLARAWEEGNIIHSPLPLPLMRIT